MRLGQFIDQHLQEMREARICSKNTVEAYSLDLTQACEFFGSTTEINSIDTLGILRFVRYLTSKKIGSRSIARKLSALRGLFQNALNHRILATNPALDVSAPKRGKKLPNVLSPEAIKKLLDHPISANDPEAVRDQALFELLYSSGLRLSEALGLKVKDAKLLDSEIRVLGKREKQRIVPIGRPAVEAIRNWLNLRHQFDKGISEAVFLSRKGKTITARTIQRRLALRAKVAGLDQHVHPHVLRHSVATHLLESSRDLRAGQEFLGHQNLATTQIYTHLDFQHLTEIYYDTHPRAKINS